MRSMKVNTNIRCVNPIQNLDSYVRERVDAQISYLWRLCLLEE